MVSSTGKAEVERSLRKTMTLDQGRGGGKNFNLVEENDKNNEE